MQQLVETVDTVCNSNLGTHLKSHLGITSFNIWNEHWHASECTLHPASGNIEIRNTTLNFDDVVLWIATIITPCNEVLTQFHIPSNENGVSVIAQILQ